MEKALRVWDWLEKYVAAVVGLIATLLLLYSIFMRYFFKTPPEWTEEIVIYMFILIIYITASSLAAEGRHVRATFVVERLPEKYRRGVEVMNGFLALGFCLGVTYLALLIVKATFLSGERSESSLRFPMWITFLCVPMGTSLLSLRYIRRLYRLFFRFSPEDL
jgi:C4-dicarboxylate transporter DctQ subunit